VNHDFPKNASCSDFSQKKSAGSAMFRYFEGEKKQPAAAAAGTLTLNDRCSYLNNYVFLYNMHVTLIPGGKKIMS